MAGQAEENKTSSIDKEHNDMNDLNAKLAAYITMVETKKENERRLLQEMEQMKDDFLKTQSSTELKYEMYLEEMRSSSQKSVEETKLLKAELDIMEKSREISVKEDLINELRETFLEKDKKISKLEEECYAHKTKIYQKEKDYDRIVKENEKIRTEHKTILTKTMEAENEYENLAKENNYLEMSLKLENEKLRKLISTLKFSQPNLKEVQEAVYSKCIKEIQAEYESHFTKLKEKQQDPYKKEIERLKIELIEMKNTHEKKYSNLEHDHVVNERRSTDRLGSLELEISVYRKLLKKSGIEESYDLKTEVKKNQTGEQTKGALEKSSVKQTTGFSYNNTEFGQDLVLQSTQARLWNEKTEMEESFELQMEEKPALTGQHTQGASEISRDEQTTGASDDTLD